MNATEAAEELVGLFRREFKALFRCEPEVVDALVRVRTAGWSIAVVTNGSPGQLDKITAADLAPLVDTWCISDVMATTSLTSSSSSLVGRQLSSDAPA